MLVATDTHKPTQGSIGMSCNSKILGHMAAVAVGLLLAVGPAAPIYGQRSEDRDRRDSDRRDDDRRDRDRDRERRRNDDDDENDRERRRRRRPSDEERRRSYITKLDRNGDGKIERSEVDDRNWGYFERAAKAAGFDTSKAISVETYLSTRKTQEATKARQKLREENPTAFLPQAEATKAPGFDTPLTEPELVMLNPEMSRSAIAVESATTKADSETSSTRESKNTGDDSRGDRTARYAASLVERYDKNKNSILEKEEWKEMRGDPEKSDLNKDGRITKDELVKRFSNYRRGDDDKQEKKDSGERKREERPSRSSRNENESETRNSYRFTSASDRLPKDARSWIERYDDNSDAQVAMAEFSSTWTDSKVREFEKYDLNGDGIVTGEEYVEAK